MYFNSNDTLDRKLKSPKKHPQPWANWFSNDPGMDHIEMLLQISLKNQKKDIFEKTYLH